MDKQITLITDQQMPKKCQICSKRGDCGKRRIEDSRRRAKLIEECEFYLMGEK